MSQHPKRGISRLGLDAAFEVEETRKSSLILEAQLLREQQDETAAEKFAQAAEIEERLGTACEAKSLTEKAFVHRFSAASCWAQAGNFYRAIALCDDLLARTDLSDRLRHRVEEYAAAIRARRSQWYEGLVLAPTSSER